MIGHEKFKTLEELVNSLSTKNYDERIEEYTAELSNAIQNGDKKAIDYYQRCIDRLEESKEEANIVLAQLNDAVLGVKELSQERVLLYNLEQLIGYSREDALILSEDFKKFNETKTYEENRKEYSKLYKKTTKPISQQTFKISKNAYKLIKKNAKIEVLIKFADMRESELSLSKAFEENDKSISSDYSLKMNIINDVENYYEDYDYHRYLEENDIILDGKRTIADLGVDVEKLNYIFSCYESGRTENLLSWMGSDALKKLENIKQAKEKHINTNGGYSKLLEAEQKYQEILELDRENYYLNEIIEAFKNTRINKSEMYSDLYEMVREQDTKIYKLKEEADKLYEKIGLQNKMDLIKQLEELYIKSEGIRLEVERYRKMGINYERRADLLQQNYHETRSAMISILRANPDLDKPKYGINIAETIKKEREILEPEVKQQMSKEQEKNKIEKTVVVKPEIKESEKEKEIPTHIKTKDVEMFIEKTPPHKFKDIELNQNLQTQRTVYYQNYMREKVMNSNLGKLPFSQYIESVAPQLTELIRSEKERESLAETIYKDYIKYYGELDNKKYAMKFEEYAKNRYGIVNIDLPIEKEEEYRGMIR